KGAEQAVSKCARVQPGERVVIITDLETQQIAAAMRQVAEQITPGGITTFVLEDFGGRPEDGSKPLGLPNEIERVMRSADVSFFAASGKKGEVGSLRIPLIRVVYATGTLRHGHMPGITEELMRMGMCADYEEVQRVSAGVGEIVRGARHIRVTSAAGTDFTAEFSPSLKWVVCDGLLRPGKTTNLPDGEVFTCPYDVEEGLIVIDGILGDYFSAKYGLVENTPVTWEIGDGRVRKVACVDDGLRAELEEYMGQDENANRLGEFAIGTNTGVERLVGNMLQDEKYPGVHVAVGHPSPEETGADWTSTVHLDGVLKKVTIDVEGQVIMREGRFIL
ncbi:MAG TPA: aminopeptidase, partial [Anaerolineae bacterium]|nr:aminopeptidase [Anaerolineae bacterium]